MSNAQLASGSPIVSSDGKSLLFYFGYGGSLNYAPGTVESIYSEYVEATGVAVLRRDGFASIATRRGKPTGRLLTRPIVYTGNRLFVNVRLPSAQSSLKVEVLAAYTTKAGCEQPKQQEEAASSPAVDGGGLGADEQETSRRLSASGGSGGVLLRGPLDSTMAEVKGGRKLFGASAGRRVRLRFTLSQGEEGGGGEAELFAFWMSENGDGRSGGFLGGGRLGVRGVVS